MNAFALLDMGKPGVPLGPFHPKDCFIASRGLFEGTPEERLTVKGPWLATMTTDRGFDYRAYVERELAPHGAAVWLDTPLSFDDTFGHLRQFMQVRVPSGGRALLRFWDGSVFHRLTYVLRPDQYAALVAPFSRWETTATPKVSFSDGPATTAEDVGIELPLTLSARQVAMLSLPMVQRVAHKLTREIWHGNPRARAGRDPLVVLGAVQRAYRFALEHLRLSDLHAVADWVKADAGWALYIANLHAAPERFTFTTFGDAANEEVNVTWERIKDFFARRETSLTTTEWLYKGLWFDGFWRRYCTVVEAKGNFEQMFPEFPRTGPAFARFVLSDWVKSYARQSAAVKSAMPRARLEWHFMQEGSWRQALQMGISVAKLTPPPSAWI